MSSNGKCAKGAEGKADLGNCSTVGKGRAGVKVGGERGRENGPVCPT